MDVRVLDGGLEVTLKDRPAGFSQIFDAFNQRTKLRVASLADAVDDKTNVLHRIFITEFDLVEEQLGQTALQRSGFVLNTRH